jgi:hypothetical protein
MDRQPRSQNESHRRFRLILSTCGVVATGGELSVQHLHTRPGLGVGGKALGI